MSDFQSVIALAIVGVTILIMLYFKIKKKDFDCGENCSCAGKNKKFSGPGSPPENLSPKA